MDITWKRKWKFWLLLAVMLLFLPGKTFAAEKESREAEDSYIYHTAFDAKASLKISHMKDYGVLDYEETVTVEDSCDYLDGDENLDEIQAKITAYDSKVVNFGVAAIYWLSSEYQNATGSRYPCAFVSSFSQRS